MLPLRHVDATLLTAFAQSWLGPRRQAVRGGADQLAGGPIATVSRDMPQSAPGVVGQLHLPDPRGPARVAPDRRRTEQATA